MPRSGEDTPACPGRVTRLAWFLDASPNWIGPDPPTTTESARRTPAYWNRWRLLLRSVQLLTHHPPVGTGRTLQSGKPWLVPPPGVERPPVRFGMGVVDWLGQDEPNVPFVDRSKPPIHSHHLPLGRRARLRCAARQAPRLRCLDRLVRPSLRQICARLPDKPALAAEARRGNAFDQLHHEAGAATVSLPGRGRWTLAKWPLRRIRKVARIKMGTSLYAQPLVL